MSATYYQGLLAAVNSMEASRWELLLARIFGRSYQVDDEMGNRLHMVHWRGTTYLLRYARKASTTRPANTKAGRL